MTAHNSMLAVTLGSVGVLALAFGTGRPPLYIWNASASVPLGLYRLQPSNTRYIGELVAVAPPEPLATFLADGSYLPRGVPMLKRVLALPGQTVCRNGPRFSSTGLRWEMRASVTVAAACFPFGKAVTLLAPASSSS